MVTISSRIPKSRQEEILSEISRVVHAVPSLTPRPKSELRAALQSRNLAVALDRDEVVGWLLATPFSSKVQELGMAYIEPAYRDAGILKRLIDELIDRRSISVAVTYETRLQASLMKHWGFEPSSLRECVRLSKGKFLLHRLTSLRSLSAIVRHTIKKKPMYLVYREG